MRDAFRARGHDAMSCDLQPTAKPGPHYQGDVRDVLHDGWDLMIAHPECRYLCLSGARWYGDDRYPEREHDFEAAIDFFLLLKNADIARIAIENSQPLGRTIQRVGRYDQAVQPWQFGDPFSKGAYWWLKNLPPLIPTHSRQDYDAIYADCHGQPPGPDRSKLRARTYPGIAEACAMQWGEGCEPDWKNGLFAKAKQEY